MGNNNYVYDVDDAIDGDQEDAYLSGYEEGRLEAGGGLPTLLGGMFLGGATVAIAWIMTVIW